MKKLILVSLSAFVGAVIAVAIIGLPLFVHAGPPPVRETIVPGDTNCDGKLDMSDAIFTLNYLFQGTAFPPCPLADPPELVARIAALEAELAKKSADLGKASAQVLSLQADLAEKDAKLGTCQADLSDSSTSLSDCRRRHVLPSTGLTKCYDTSGAEIPCNSATCPGQDGFYGTGCPSEGRFIDNGDGTVTDNCTGLMWQKDSADVNGDGQWSDHDFVPWCDAIAYCENFNFAGHDDWRLPSVRELQSIVDYGRNNPAIDPVFGTTTSVYWSSTSRVAGPATAWVVYFSVGDGGVRDKADDIYVRAVRSGP